MFRIKPAIAVLGLSGLLLVAACGEEEGAPATPTTTTAATEAASPTAPAVATETPAPAATPTFEGGREPVEAPAQSQGAPLLADVRTGEHEGYDRITFEFEGDGRPAYRVEYITAPATGCGSGLPATIAGAALLQARFAPANAHDDQGTPTFGSTELTPGLTSIVEAEQTCDFEAHVTWVIGLSQEVDFRVFELEDPPRIAIDLQHQ